MNKVPGNGVNVAAGRGVLDSSLAIPYILKCRVYAFGSLFSSGFSLLARISCSTLYLS